MLPGPVFNVELLTTARRPRYYAIRVIYGLALLVVVWQNYANWDRFGGALFSPQEMTRFAQSAFLSLIALQGIMVLAMTPSLVAGVIANEKQRKTLHYLLASQLSSAEIVLGKLLARMLHVAVFLAIGLPILSLLSLFGGVDPLFVLLATAGTFSVAFFLAALSVLCSTMSKRVREAITGAYVLEAAWLFLPLMVRSMMPWTYPRLYFHIQPINEWFLASTPWAPFPAFVGMGRPLSAATIVEDTFWMMGLQAAAGVVFLTIAVLRLRPIFKAQEGTVGFRFLGIPLAVSKTKRIRLFGRKPVGDDAMMWKELHTSRTSGMAQVVGILVSLAVVGTIGYWTWIYGYDAYVELQGGVYDNLGMDRRNFNLFLRFVSTAAGVISILASAVGGANALTSEREDDTWISLVATPLGGLEIIRAKMLGVLWKLRWLLSLVAVLWVVGMFCGAVHPIGVLFVTIQYVSFITFGTALGTFFSLHSKSTWRAQSTTIGVLLFVGGGYLACCCPVMFRSQPSLLILMGCMPFILAVSLMSPWDVTEYLNRGAAQYGTRVQNETVEIVLACVIGTIGFGIAAACLTIAAFSNFDHAADRPRRDLFGSPVPPPPDLPPEKAKDTGELA